MIGHSIFTLVFFYAMCADFTISNVNYYHITPSAQNVSCPQEPCLTLSQFATNSSQYDSNITLLFQPGNHSFEFELFMVKAINITMVANVQDNEVAFVRCTSQSGRFRIRHSIFVLIKGLHFVGCGGN